jgi:triosephosphate isomerase
MISPNFTSLNIFSDNENIVLWAQNMSSEISWAFTWEISPEMLVDLNCRYVILGHCEVRKNLWENSELIIKKAKLALKNNIIPIICISDKSQLLDSTKNILDSEIIIAYEPLSAIWTWNIDSIENISKNIDFIKNKLQNKNSRIIYWWSVNSKNCLELSKITNLNWFLIWGASLKVDSLLEIVKKVKK